jgi:hypothetical protein
MSMNTLCNHASEKPGTWNNGCNNAIFQGEPNLHTLNPAFNPRMIPEEIVSITNGFNSFLRCCTYLSPRQVRAITQRNGSATSLVIPAITILTTNRGAHHLGFFGLVKY